MHRLARRRAVFGGILAGGIAAPLAGAPSGAAPASAPAAWTPRIVRARSLRAGDLVVGPEGATRRVAEAQPLATGLFRILFTDDQTGRSVGFGNRWDVPGVDAAMTFVVLARDTPVRAVRFGAARILDGGPVRSIKTTLRLRRGTVSEWAELDPVLGPGEPGFEIDTMRLKIGDGGASWTDLPYLAGAGSVATEPGLRSHFVGDDLTLRRPAYVGPVDWVTSVDGVPDHIRKGDWITRVQTVDP